MKMQKCDFLPSLVAFLCVITSSSGHVCRHKPPPPEKVLRTAWTEPYHTLRKRQIDQNLRFNLHFDGSIDALPEEHSTFIKETLIPEATLYWSETLQVREVVQTIKLQRECNNHTIVYLPNLSPHALCTAGCSEVTKCGDIVIPEEHLDVCRNYRPFTNSIDESLNPGEGVKNSDYLLYVSASHTDSCNEENTVAYAAYCQQESSLDRPVAGYVNFCPKQISTEAYDRIQMVSTMKHEILHALGFSAGLYAFYRDDNGIPLTPRSPLTNLPPFNSTLNVYQWSDNVIRRVLRPQWKIRNGLVDRYINVLVTPRVVTEAQNHFYCFELEGAELEDQGPIGTSYSHWEKRLFENEAMTGGYTQNPVISRLTLALMEDTGWYRANYRNSATLKWGYELGCDFALRSCADWIRTQKANALPVAPYCERPRVNGTVFSECTEDYKASAVCNMIKHPEPLEAQYQYFESLEGVPDNELQFYGGSVGLADYCPFLQEFSWETETGEKIQSSNCLIPFEISGENNYLLESHSEESRCFEHDSQWKLQNCGLRHDVQDWGSGCYKIRCHANAGLLVSIGDREYQCQREHQVINFTIYSLYWKHEGSIRCGNCDELCFQYLPWGCPSENRLEVLERPRASRPPDGFEANCEQALRATGAPAAPLPRLAAISTVLLTLLQLKREISRVLSQNSNCKSQHLQC